MLADQRGVSNVLGFVLAFSLVVTTFAIYQADVIPHQNREIEFEYTNELEGEMSHLKEGLDSVAATGVGSTVTVTGSPTYPKRALGINAEAGTGQFVTTQTYDVDLEGFNATGEYWDESRRSFDTRLLRFTPRFNYYQSDVAFYLENGVFVKRFPGEDATTWRRGGLVSGNQINVVLLSGELSRTGRTIAVPFRSVSTSPEYRTVTVDGSATVRVPTVRTQDAWDEVEAGNDNITAVSVTNAPGAARYAEITLDDGQYELRIANVTVDEPSTPPAAYVTMEPITAVTASNGQTFVVTTRDRFGNPVANVDVDLSLSGQGALTTQQVTTDDDGQATFGVTNAEVGVSSVTATVDDGNPGYEEVSRTVGGTGPAGDSRTFAVYTSGQHFAGLSGAGSLNLSEGMMVPNSESDCLLLGDAGGLLGGLLGSVNCESTDFESAQGELALDTDSGTFTATYSVLDWNRNGNVKEDDTGPCADAFCTDRMDDGGYVEITNPSGSPVFQGRLSDAAAQDVLEGYGSTDVLDTGRYQTIDGTYDSIPSSLSNADDVFVRQATGRVTVTVSDD